MVQRQVHLWRDECSTFAVGRRNAAIAFRWAQVQGVGRSCSKGITKQAALEWKGVIFCPVLSSVVPTGSVVCEATGGVHVSVLWKESEGKQ